MALPIRSIAAPVFGALLAIAGAPGAAWAGEPAHPANHHDTNGGSRPAPVYQPHEQPRAALPPSNAGRGGGAPVPGGQAWNRPAPVAIPQGGPSWHGTGSIPANRPGNGWHGQVYANSNYSQPSYSQPNHVQPSSRQQGFTATGQVYRGNRYDGRRWNNGWRNDRRYDWAGWRSAHGELFHGSYYYPPYDGYGYARLGIGAALDAAFLDEQYWIEDPSYYHLPPAYGPYRWVRYYNDCLLIDIDTGQIVDVLYNVFW